MGQFIYFILFAIGLIMIIKGSDLFLDSTLWVAGVFKIPHIIIGATIVSICTSLPETFVSVSAAIKGETDMAIGNAIGSIAFNTGIIMAILILFGRPRVKNPRQFKISSIWLTSSIIFVWIVGLIFGELNRTIGIILLIFLVIYLIQNISSSQATHSNQTKIKYDTSLRTVIKKTILFIIGITLVIWGSNLLVDNGIKIALILKVPSILIAVTFTAFGTSLPEFFTTITAIRKGVSNIGFGNIIGANTLNILQVTALSAVFQPLRINHDPIILLFQIPMTLLIVIFAIIAGNKARRSIAREYGLLLLASYTIFVIVNLLRDSTPIIGKLLF
ncbi:MAG: sodium:calcium antiporter [Clostridiales bacterium]|jgi:cation:H+ antiporter|nr:sodium:calcium antiporter [Clostridiales bacterium]